LRVGVCLSGSRRAEDILLASVHHSKPSEARDHRDDPPLLGGAWFYAYPGAHHCTL